MTRGKRILFTAAAVTGAVAAVAVVASLVVLQSDWFADYVKQKIISVAEESTGGKVDIGSFQFDLSHLTVRIRNFVLHGTEPAQSPPLLRASLLELHLKLLSGLKKAVDLQYLGIDQPQANVMVFPNGTTNIPNPKVPSKPSNKSGLETIVDLAVNKFEITNGLLQFSQQSIALNLRGENLKAQLLYNVLSPSYQGSLLLDPLLASSGSQPPLRTHLDVPIKIEKDALRLNDVKLTTAQSQLLLNGSIENMKAPIINAHLNGSLSLPELGSSLALPLDATAKGAPQTLTLDAAVRLDDQRINIEAAHLALGKTTFEASGVVRDPSTRSGAQFNGHLELAELAPLLKVTTPKAGGALDLHGSARLDAQSNYFVDGTVNSKDLSLRSGTTRLSNISLNTPFHADPFLISLDGLRLNAFGGDLAAKIFVEKMQQLSVEGSLHNLNLQALTLALAGKRIGYDGVISGPIKAQGDLKAKGTNGFLANARLAVAPGQRGVPISGRVSVDYRGATDSIVLADSYIALPHSRLDLSGALNKRLDLKLVSRNLNDFLPAAQFASTGKPMQALPVTLEGGTAQVDAQVTGNLAAPRINGHLALTRFAVQQRSFDNFSLDLAASPSLASVSNGLLTRKALRTNFDGSLGLRRWSPVPRSSLAANLSLRNGDIADLLSLAGESSIPATGNLTADVHVNGTYGNPLGSATLQVLEGSAYQESFDRLYTKVDLADQLVTLSTFEVSQGAAKIAANGTFAHPRDSFSTGHAQLHVATANLQLANLRDLERKSPGIGGLIQLTADAGVDLRQVNKQSEVTIANLNADLSARGLRVQNQDAGDLTATARTSNNTVTYKINSNFAGSSVNVNGQTVLAKAYPTTADAIIQNLPLDKTLRIAGQSSIPATGMFSANAHLAGTLDSPNADLSFSLANANLYNEPLNRLQGSVRYSNTLLDVPSIELDAPAGRLTLTGSFSHPANDLHDGSVKLRINSTAVSLANIQTLQREKPGIAGTLRLAADLSANLREQNGKQQVLLENVNADASTSALRLNNLPFGDASFKARTTGSNVNFSLDSDIAKSRIHGAGTAQLSADYPVQANLTFANIKYSNLAPYFSTQPGLQPSFDALVEGELSVNGPVLRTDALTAKLQLNRFEAMTTPHGSVTGAPAIRSVTIHNEGPVVVALNRMDLQVQQAHLTGPQTDIKASGDVNLNSKNAPLNLSLNANTNLSILEDLDRDFFSSGTLDLNASVRGSFAQPLVNGRVELKNANVNYADAPNGLSNANGVIVLNGTSASIQNLTAESGGGRITLSGFLGLTGTTVNYNVKATASRVRTRYSGASLTSNAAINLTGNTEHSLLQGTVTLTRIAYQSSSDAGSILSGASTPVSTPTAPSGLLAGMKLDIRIGTSPGLRVVTTYAQRLHVEADLSVRGTAASPGVVGRVAVTDGTLVFFGNEYTVNQGTITFYDASRIQPILNLDLETIAQGVDVTIGLQGPVDNLKLTYRSDPPLRFEEIVELLATNKTPQTDPTIAARQPTPPQQSFSQLGESAVVGQAVAAPLANRVQRVFGVSQFKIDPTFQGNSGIPQARVTLQQQVTNNVTFTYITDVTQTNSQIIRVEWAFTPKFSAVAIRDENGVVGVDFLYKRKIQ